METRVLLRLVLVVSCAVALNLDRTKGEVHKDHLSSGPLGQQEMDQHNSSHHFRSSVRLRKFQLKKQVEQPKTPEQKFKSLLEPSAEDLEHRGPAEKINLVQGPNLNPPMTQQSKAVKTFQPSLPVPADVMAVRCGEGEVNVEVKRNFFGNNLMIRPGELTLGGCGAKEVSDQVLHFQTELQECGSTMTMTDDVLIYSFTLTYSPSPIGNTFIFRTNPAQVLVQCHYQRRHFVSSDSVKPAWTPSASSLSAVQRLNFSLHLMADDWQLQRPSNTYFLNDAMHIQASVLQRHHAPLRIYVDSCVGTMDRNPNTQPQHHFISNHGCLGDAKSYFLPRNQEDKLHLQLKAFQFHRDHRTTLYMTCHLKATTVSTSVDPRHKACSYLSEASRWVASGGDNKVCSCCESSCSGQRRRRGVAAADPGPWWEGSASREALPPRPVAAQPEPGRGAAGQSVALMGAGVLLGLLACMAAVIYRRVHKAPGQALT